MAAEKKSGRITLRMDPVTHGRAAGTARTLGMGINDLLNLIIREGLTKYEMQAQIFRRTDVLALLEEWRRFNPSREVSSFFADCYSLMQGKVVTFENGKRYGFLSKRWVQCASEVEMGMVVAALMQEPEGFTEVNTPLTPDEEIPF